METPKLDPWIKDHLSLKPGDKVALCRCWQSKRFPLCDGSHRKLNTTQGPIIVEAKSDQ
ncbi:CDGSH iron-sulfur domain-containing protein [Candidatus Synchoanobacter obligatus]|uniref:CDGSH iron-sulfur domain-containing protein n=1 Tax=Candidatus Synchoanobacter obligatus TaxID=2919597 RepID=A0ABT1L536_9GAMM|nr:CDGSH iron-sulfur domain-containing protein [Candidatus Synchoanobacter obligatus]MCP8352295.1 CDGSH iron-sulfur domain-containing protein [Candidatus Synchoanobacter obligatus]